MAQGAAVLATSAHAHVAQVQPLEEAAISAPAVLVYPPLAAAAATAAFQRQELVRLAAVTTMEATVQLAAAVPAAVPIAVVAVPAVPIVVAAVPAAV